MEKDAVGWEEEEEEQQQEQQEQEEHEEREVQQEQQQEEQQEQQEQKQTKGKMRRIKVIILTGIVPCVQQPSQSQGQPQLQFSTFVLPPRPHSDPHLSRYRQCSSHVPKQRPVESLCGRAHRVRIRRPPILYGGNMAVGTGIYLLNTALRYR